jgi:hypothetical protein
MMAVAVIAAVGLITADRAVANHATGCTTHTGVNQCYLVGEEAAMTLYTATSTGGACTVKFKVDWGDGSPVEEVTDTTK